MVAPRIGMADQCRSRLRPFVTTELEVSERVGLSIQQFAKLGFPVSVKNRIQLADYRLKPLKGPGCVLASDGLVFCGGVQVATLGIMQSETGGP